MTTGTAAPAPVQLQGVGRFPGTYAQDVKAGDTLIWNYGHKSTVVAVRELSPKFVEITTLVDGKKYVSRYGKRRTVVRAAA